MQAGVYLPYEVAKRRVDEFASLEADSSECSACAAFLAAGIEAADAIRVSEKVLFDAARLGIAQVERDIVEAIYYLYEAWLIPCSRANAWIDRQAAKGDEPSNLEQFRTTRQLIETIVAKNAILRAADEPMFEESESMPAPPLPSIPTVQIPIQRLVERQ